MDWKFPLRSDGRGRTAEASYDEHIQDLLEQLLFTGPGERVNRPTFGTGLAQMVFAPGGDEQAAATRFLVEGAVQQWLGDLVQVELVDAEHVDSTLRVTVVYRVRRTQEQRQVQFQRSV